MILRICLQLCTRSPWFILGNNEIEMFLDQKCPKIPKVFCASSGIAPQRHDSTSRFRFQICPKQGRDMFRDRKKAGAALCELMFDNTSLPVCKGMTMNLANETTNRQVLLFMNDFF